MHLRRALLLMAMILLVTAVVVALVPPRRSQAPAPVGVPPFTPSTPLRSVSLRFPPPKSAPVTRLVQGDHVVITVTTAQTGEASALGLTDTAEPGTPATLDVLVPSPGLYAATFTPTLGKPQRIGTLDVSGSGRRP